MYAAAEKRERQARTLCRRLTEEITVISPQGLGCWLPDRHSARTAADDFVEVLSAWVEERATDQQLRAAHDEAVLAWQNAAEEFEVASAGGR